MRSWLIPFVMLAALAGPQSFAGKIVGNGGGGELKDGVYMTFYSAGLYVEPQLPDPSDIPGLSSLQKYISDSAFLSFKTKGAILNAVLPAASRNYFVADSNQLTPDVKEQLLAEYSKITGVNTKNLQLFALTDIQAKNTFILPEFFKLSLEDQQAILFHEAYWLMHPDATYRNVLGAEMAFEAALSDPNNTASVYDFVSRVGSADEIEAAGIKRDLSDGSLKGLTQNDAIGSYILLRAFLTSDFVACEESLWGDAAGYSSHGVVDQQCVPFLLETVGGLINEFPKSFFLRSLYDFFDKNRLSALFYLSKPMPWDRLAECRLYMQPGANIFCESTEERPFCGGLDFSSQAEIDMLHACLKSKGPS